MQVKISPESMKALLDEGELEVSQQSESQIVAYKRMDHGSIHMRWKRQATPYMLEERHYWLGDIHFEKGLRPYRLFDSEEVREFVEKYVSPFTGES